MISLLKLAIRNRNHFFLLIITVFLALLMSLASQMEMFAIGLLTNSGPDFFSLFSPKKIESIESDKKKKKIIKKAKISGYFKSNNSTNSNKVSLEEVQERWKEIDVHGKGYITKTDAADYMNRNKCGANILVSFMMKARDKFKIANNIALLVFILSCVALFKVTCSFLNRYTVSRVGIRVSTKLRQEYFDHLQTLPMSFFQKYNIGQLSSRVTGDAGSVSNSIIAFILNYCQMPFTVITCLYFLFRLSFQLSVIIFIGLPLLGLPIYLLAKKARKAQREMQEYGEAFAHILIDYLAGIQTIKLFNMEDFSSKKYQEMNDRKAKIETKIAFYGYISRPILHMIGTLFLGLIIVYGLYVIKMNVSDLVVYVGLMHLFYEPIKKFGEENIKIQRGLIGAERMFKVLNEESNIKDKPNAKKLKHFKDEIVFDKVWFQYIKDTWVIKDLSFTVKKGQTVALVGPTGAGKSTIAQLLPRLYDVQKGRILVDGIPITDYKQRSLREGISFVPQRPFLFFDTVAKNISHGENLPEEEIIQAAKRAHADKFIKCLPDQYNTMLAEMGKSLSGGQQQRLAIARALAKKADVLVMDEATSSLDSISENKIKQAIHELRGSMTQIIIAHRLSTIEDADKIIYIEFGEKVAEGTKDELYANCSGFKAMWDMMFKREQKQMKEETLAITE